MIEDDLKRLAEQKEVRTRDCVRIHLDACLRRVENKEEAIGGIIEEAKTRRAAETRLCDLLSRVVVEAADGNLVAREYTQKAMSKQAMFVYVSTHWMPIRTQVYYDFVKDGAALAGLPEEFLESPEFMNRLFEQTAFRVARDRELQVPRGQVWINLQNGTLEVDGQGRTCFRGHVRDDFFTYVLPYPYEPGAECPRWKAFLDQVLPEEGAQMLLGEFIGYCFTDMKLEKMLILYGGGSNGKSVTTDVIRELLGRENVSSVDLEKLTTDDNHRSLMEGKLANIAQENGPNVQYSVLKTMVSGEPVMVKTLYKDPKLMYQYGKLISSYNKLPKTENTEGFFRRWILMPFDVTIKEEERDVRLKDKLCEELPGILNWVLEGLLRLVRQRAFTASELCNRALEQYKLNSNSALRFLDERCVANEAGQLTLKELYTEYVRWCNEDGVQNKFGRNAFAEILEKDGAQYVVVHRKKYYRMMFRGD